MLKSIAGSTISVGALGTASADDREATQRQLYIVLAGGNGLRSHIERTEFEVLHELAGGSALIVEGPSDKSDALRTSAVVDDIIANETHVVDIERSASEGSDSTEPQREKQWDKQLVRARAAHERATGAETTIAIIDTGVSHSHPALASRIDAERSRLFRYGRVHAGTDDTLVAEAPANYYPSIRETTQHVSDDVHGHGTHVAGIAATGRNETGIVGMAPDAEIVSLRSFFFERIADINPTFPDETIGVLMGSITDILLAIDYAAENGVDVINLSLGQTLPPDSRAYAAYRRVIQHAVKQGVVVVVAAENYGWNLDDESEYVLPADVPGASTVAATGPTDKRSHYSNYGDGAIDVAAPGGRYETTSKSEITDHNEVAYPDPTNGILSTVPESIYGELYDYNYGTSMAAPQVAGLAALLRELEPDRHPRRIQQAIAQGAVDLSGEYTEGLGAGRIDAPSALDRITNGR
ncbi:S8 family serine peptidase [Haloterrigena salifodinae]|uniref:S8 family serine peptidase n=1 Tax=Haloterrigena salifodinae TaxID=2675099 RepID=A0A8T8DXS4_9EURY|nr:S8 family serine peptidase [Haloterrigena salifodinae]QRV14378.1 S8 family serine peptidase [Haloterrigena salifodinae]